MSTAKLLVSKDFLPRFRLPDGYTILNLENMNEYYMIVSIEGPFPLSIPNNSDVTIQLKRHNWPREYIEWQWVYNDIVQGELIEMTVD